MQKQQDKHTKKRQYIGNKSESYRGPLSNELTDANTGVWRFKRPVVDRDKCITCNICTEYCPCGVIERKTIDIDLFFCKGCGICAEVCPKRAIDFVDEDQAGKEGGQ